MSATVKFNQNVFKSNGTPDHQTETSQHVILGNIVIFVLPVDMQRKLKMTRTIGGI